MGKTAPKKTTKKKKKKAGKMPVNNKKRIGLTAKRRQFVKEYIIDLNGTQAAIRAGYSKRSAASTAKVLKATPEVREAINKEIEAREKRTEITQDKVLREIARIAFLDPKNFFDEHNNLIDVNKLEENIRRVISGFHVTTRREGRGDDIEYVETTRVKFVDKIKGLEMAMDHLRRLMEGEDDFQNGESLIINECPNAYDQPDGPPDPV